MSKKQNVKICLECGSAFVPKNARQVVCSPTCSENRHRKQNKKYREAKKIARRPTCAVCGKEFETTHKTKITCSEECSKIYHKEWARERSRTHSKKFAEPKAKQIAVSGALAEEARKAKELGMSYGMYKAMKLMEGECYE